MGLKPPNDQFPRGQLNEDDEGKLMIAMLPDFKHDVVRIEFGKAVAWLALDSKLAREIAERLLDFANKLDERRH